MFTDLYSCVVHWIEQVFTGCSPVIHRFRFSPQDFSPPLVGLLVGVSRAVPERGSPKLIKTSTSMLLYVMLIIRQLGFDGCLKVGVGGCPARSQREAPPERTRAKQLGNFASQDLDVCLRVCCGSFAENRGDLRRRRIRAKTMQKSNKILSREIPQS